MTNEVVKHHNDLNTVIMRKWTAEEMNFFFAIIAKARDNGIEDLVFDKYQLAELTSYSIQHNKRFHDTMNSLANNITQLRYIEKQAILLSICHCLQDFEWIGKKICQI